VGRPAEGRCRGWLARCRPAGEGTGPPDRSRRSRPNGRRSGRRRPGGLRGPDENSGWGRGWSPRSLPTKQTERPPVRPAAPGWLARCGRKQRLVRGWFVRDPGGYKAAASGASGRCSTWLIPQIGTSGPAFGDLACMSCTTAQIWPRQCGLGSDTCDLVRVLTLERRAQGCAGLPPLQLSPPEAPPQPPLSPARQPLNRAPAPEPPSGRSRPAACRAAGQTTADSAAPLTSAPAAEPRASPRTARQPRTASWPELPRRMPGSRPDNGRLSRRPDWEPSAPVFAAAAPAAARQAAGGVATRAPRSPGPARRAPSPAAPR